MGMTGAARAWSPNTRGRKWRSHSQRGRSWIRERSFSIFRRRLSGPSVDEKNEAEPVLTLGAEAGPAYGAAQLYSSRTKRERQVTKLRLTEARACKEPQ